MTYGAKCDRWRKISSDLTRTGIEPQSPVWQSDTLPRRHKSRPYCHRDGVYVVLIESPSYRTLPGATGWAALTSIVLCNDDVSQWLSPICAAYYQYSAWANMSLYYSGFFLGVDTTNYDTDDGDYIWVYLHRWTAIMHLMIMDHGTSTIHSSSETIQYSIINIQFICNTWKWLLLLCKVSDQLITHTHVNCHVA